MQYKQFQIDVKFSKHNIHDRNYNLAVDFVRNWSYENIIPAAVKFNFTNDVTDYPKI
jgi:hypothetical protein